MTRQQPSEALFKFLLTLRYSCMPEELCGIVGNMVTIGNMVFVGSMVTIGNMVIVGSMVTISSSVLNDIIRIKNYEKTLTDLKN